MTNENKGDLVISGVGRSSGGTFERVKVSGTAKINGDLECTSFLINGKGDVTGSLSTELVEIHGESSIHGDVQTHKTKVRGKFRVEGRLISESIECGGELKIKGSCEAECFYLQGGFSIDGMLNAGTVDISFSHTSRTQEIGGGTITVRRHGFPLAQLLTLNLLPLSPKLTVHTVEGDEVYLEYTKADIVRGARITIGPGCEIERVEYTERLQQDDGAKVTQAIKQ